MPTTTTGPPRLGRPAVRVFAEPLATEPSELESRFLTDFLADFDLEFDPELYARGGGHSFIHMSAELLAGLDRPLPALDAALLAYHLPDLKVVEVAGCYLAARCPGDPAVFSVSGQGVGAPFTALRILSCMRASGELTDGAVFVLDQSTVPYPDPDTHDASVRDCAVLLHTEPAGAVLDFVDERPVMDPADELRRLPGVRIVAGRMLAEALDPAVRARLGLVEGPRRHLCTSAWAALADLWPLAEYTVVADYDPHGGRLFLAGLRPGAQP